MPTNDNQGGFDVVLGNPPFVNIIEGGIPRRVKALIGGIDTCLGGTADLAFQFVRLTHQITKREGRIAVVLPKTFLNADSASKLRSELNRTRPPVMLYIPKTATFFEGVSAYICLVVLGLGNEVAVSEANSLSEANWQTGNSTDDNWWRLAQKVLGQYDQIDWNDFIEMGTIFEIGASMTTGDAYMIKAHVVDDFKANGLRLVTTGLIDPFICKWGIESCKYLGKSYAHPNISENTEFPTSLNKRLRNSRRPKILIAGLANRLEACMDANGEYCGAVSTFTIFHPQDSVNELIKLCEWLNGEFVTSSIRSELGAASVGGDYMTIKKQTLIDLPVPKGLIHHKEKE